MTKRRRDNTRHLDDAREHPRILAEHLTRGSLDDVLIRDGVCHRLEVAVDAVNKIDPALLEAEAPRDRPKIVGMRNLIAHQYSDLDQEILQNTIDHRLPDFIELVDRPHSRATDRGEA